MNRTRMERSIAIRFGKIRLPHKGPGRMASLKLTAEVTRWPFAAQDDTVMAQWFGELALPNLKVQGIENPKLRVPSWMQQRSVAGYL